MILHFSHIGFTDGRTFMIPFGSKTSEAGSGRRRQAAATGRGRTLAKDAERTGSTR
jgi:hypothetical protein